MVKSDFLRIYVGALMMFLTYRLVFCFVLSTLQAAEKIIQEENELSNNQKVNCRGGDLIKKKPLKGALVRFLVKRIRNMEIYRRAVVIASATGSLVSLYVMRKVGSFEWWSVIISEALPSISQEDRIILSSLRRMRDGLPYGYICIPVVSEIHLKVVSDELDEAVETWLDELTRYDKLSERDPKKNGYFVCSVIFLTGLMRRYPGVLLYILRRLQILCIIGKISVSTYLELLWQILLEGENLSN